MGVGRLATEVSLDSLHRGLAVLRVLAERGPMRPDAIARAARLPVSTTYRYLRTLRREGFVERCGMALYASGPLFERAARRRDAADHLQRLAEPILFALARRTGETVYLSVRVGPRALVLDRVEAARWRGRALPRGALHPLHIGAAGTALLAFAGERVLRQVLRDVGADADAARALRRRLAHIRASGVSVSHGEMRRGVSGVATVVLRDGLPVCALCVAGPSARLKPALPRLCGLLRQAREELERKLSAYPKAWTATDPTETDTHRTEEAHGPHPS